VRLTWELAADNLILRWVETGGPITAPPATPGFGINVIDASIERQLEGEARFEWHPQGLHCTLAVPRGERSDSAVHYAHRMIADDKSVLPIKLESGNRILLVEDEILVAMMMRDILADLGFSVVGPFSRLSDAMVAAVHDEIDGGIIDINLGGEFVYPVADVLLARSIPFVFVTGYGVESVEARFRAVPIIKKPVQRQALQNLFVAPGTAQAGRFEGAQYGAGQHRLQRAVGHS
jgi:CheY-like chemotaxis protein